MTSTLSLQTVPSPSPPSPIFSSPISPCDKTTVYYKQYEWQLETKEHYSLLNSKGIDKVMKHVFLFCLEGGWTKLPGETCFDYLVRSGNSENKTWINKHTNKLKEDYKTYDITFLHELIGKACSGISSSLEESLRDGKNLRNAVFHERDKTAIEPGTFPKIEKNALEIAAKVCKYFNNTPDETNRTRLSVEKMIRQVKEGEPTENEKTMSFVNHYLDTDAEEEMRKQVISGMKDVFIPHSATSVPLNSVFHDAKLIKQEKNSDTNSDDQSDSSADVYHETKADDQIKSMNDVLGVRDINNAHSSIIIGDPGSGKSSLLKQISLDMYGGQNEYKFPSVKNYQSLLYIICRDSFYEEFEAYLKGIWHKTMSKLMYKDVLSALKDRKLLLLIDGLDELNEKSRKLVIEVVNTFMKCEGATFIITSRLGFELEIQRLFEQNNVQYEVYKIMPMQSNQEQIEFLERYQRETPGINRPDLINAFKKLKNLGSYLNYPLFLVLICHLVMYDSVSLESISHEGKLMAELMNQSIHAMSEKMKDDVSDNQVELSEDIVKIVCQFSAQSLHRNEHKLTQETYNDMKSQIKKINHKVPFDKCLSCLFQHRSSFYGDKNARYTK